MVLQRADRIVETTTTTGTGTYNLAGAKPGFQAFVDRITSGNTVEYCCTDGVDFEIAVGTFTDASPDTLARTTIISSRKLRQRRSLWIPQICSRSSAHRLART